MSFAQMNNSMKGYRLIMAGSILFATVFGTSIARAQEPQAIFAGTWNTVTSKGKKMTITLEAVRRTTVTGSYPINGLTARGEARNGSGTVFINASLATGGFARQSVSSIRGTVTGNVLRFKWAEDRGQGAGKFTMAPDGESFEGTFSMSDNPDDTSGGTWNGARAPCGRRLSTARSSFPTCFSSKPAIR